MPSQLHESLVDLFRNRPELAPELLRVALGVELPKYTEVRIDSASLTDVQPAQYSADLVVLLVHGEPVLGIVVEVQLSREKRKRFSWPVYGTTLRAQIGCEVLVLVYTPYDGVARWAAQPIALGGDSWFTPLVIGPSGVPVVTDPAAAKNAPELAVLAAIAHGRGPDPDQAFRIAVVALQAIAALDNDTRTASRSMLYSDLVETSLCEAVRRKLQAMDPATYEFQSEIYRRFLAEGRKEGRAEGQADLVVKQLGERFGELPAATIDQIRTASEVQLMVFATRVLTAQTLEDVFAEPPSPSVA